MNAFEKVASEHGHSLGEAPCPVCGDLDGCHWPARMRPFANRPLVVCLCGSTRFYDAFQKANYEETMAGRIVLSVGFAGQLERQRVTIDGCMGPQECEVLVARSGQATPEEKKQLDHLHFRKVEMADVVFILNCGGYIGESTRNELEHAKKCGKVIRFLEPVS